MCTLLYSSRDNPRIHAIWQDPLGKASVQQELGQVRAAPCLTLLGDTDTNPGDFIHCLLSSSLPGTPLSSHHGTSNRLWQDTTTVEAVEVSAQD